MYIYVQSACLYIYIYASFPHFLPGVCGSRSIPSGTARMPKGKGKNNTEESDESEYTEVTDEGPEEAAAKKAVPVGRVSLSSSDVSSEETDPPARTKPSGASSKKARNPSSSESEAPGPGKGGKGKQTFQRCPHCWVKVSTGARCLQQHQRWNSTCIAWQYYQRGVDWTLAKEKGQRKKARREQQAWERYQQEAKGASAPRSTAAASAPLVKEKKRRKKHKEEKKEKRKAKPVSPSPDVRRTRHGKDPSTDSEGGEEKRPKVRRQDSRTLIIRMPRA